MEITWSDKLGHRSRRAYLALITPERVVMFAGETIPGMVVVMGDHYTKDGKWSHTTYRLKVADGVRAMAFHAGWNTGRVVEGIGAALGKPTPVTWKEFADAVGVSVPVAMDWLREWKGGAADRFDRVDREMAELESAQDADVRKVVVSFGGPTNRQIEDGYWGSPMSVPEHDGVEIRLRDGGDWRMVEPADVEIAGAEGRVLSVDHRSGYGGGYVSVVLLLADKPESTHPAHPAWESAQDAIDASYASAWESASTHNPFAAVLAGGVTK